MILQGNQHTRDRSTASIDDLARDPPRRLSGTWRSEPWQAGEKQDGEEREIGTGLVLNHQNTVASGKKINLFESNPPHSN